MTKENLPEQPRKHGMPTNERAQKVELESNIDFTRYAPIPWHRIPAADKPNLTSNEFSLKWTPETLEAIAYTIEYLNLLANSVYLRIIIVMHHIGEVENWQLCGLLDETAKPINVALHNLTEAGILTYTRKKKQDSRFYRMSRHYRLRDDFPYHLFVSVACAIADLAEVNQRVPHEIIRFKDKRGQINT